MASDITASSTWQEIMQQPDIWRQWAGKLEPIAQEVRNWIKNHKIREIWLCGAGTSAFIGEIVAFGTSFNETILRPIATTDFISCPEHYLQNRDDILVVQFGRSGNSSESIAMLDMLDQTMPEAHRLHITCNAKSTLATRTASGSGECHQIILPDRSCDNGFAMTSSFSTMLLTALACFLPSLPITQYLTQLANHAADIVEKTSTALPASCPERVIFLGSGPLKAAAREAALKVLELTAGQIMTQWDCPLGFRHGPKAAINEHTRVILFLHPSPYTRQYELDLADELRQQFENLELVTIGPENADIQVPTYPDARISAVLYVLTAQIWSVQWSASFGLNIDNPFTNGALSRVVKNVRIYPWIG